MSSIRPAGAADVARVAAVLTRAFAQDPVTDFLFPGNADRSARLRRFFALQVRHTYLPRGEVLVCDDFAGVMLTMGPALPPSRLRDELSNLRFILLLGRRYPESRRMARRLAATHPREPHCYLGTIGVEPDRQRQGVGGALLRTLLERCDHAGLICCLEASKLENVRLYERLGFVIYGEEHAGDDGPRIWVMRRPPQRSEAAPGIKPEVR